MPRTWLNDVRTGSWDEETRSQMREIETHLLGSATPDYQVYKLGSSVYATALTNGVASVASSTDAGVVIQRAVEALRGTGGTVAIKGSLPIATGVTTYPGIGIVGQGPITAPPFGTSQLVTASSLDGPVITAVVDPNNPTWTFFPYFANFAVAGVHANTNQDGIVVSSVNGTIDDCYIQNVGLFDLGGSGLYLTSNGKVWIDNCYFEHNQENGILSDPIVNSTIRVTNSYIFGNVLWGIDANPASFLTAVGNLVGSNGQSAAIGSGGAIKVGSSGSGGLIDGNYFFDNGPTGGYQVRITKQIGSGRWLVNSNVFKDSRTVVLNHIQTSDSGVVNAVIAGNTFTGSTSAAVRVKFNNAGEAVFIYNNHGMNPVGLLATPINTTNNSIGLIGATSTPVLSTDYTIREVDQYLVSTGGTGVSITIKDPAGNTVESGLATYAKIIPAGFKINFGAFSVAPTVTSFGL